MKISISQEIIYFIAEASCCIKLVAMCLFYSNWPMPPTGTIARAPVSLILSPAFDSISYYYN